MNYKWMPFILSVLILGCFQMNNDLNTKDQNKIPIDPDLVYGKLDNGLTYYIKQNGKPENRVELLLIVNAGSILEDDHQQGLAHFAEHMAFNGTKRFPKQELVNYLESIGMNFGADLNAYTSFDETVYMLQVPTDDEEKLVKGFEILEDWAHQVQFENEEIDKERGVVIEEWRLRSGARQRVMDKKLPIILKGSKYADRMPIGKKDILDSFEYEDLKSYYRDWYRPDLMAVVAVGDIDVDKIKSMINSYFSNLKPHENPKERQFHELPPHDETLFVVTSDPELSMSQVGIEMKFGENLLKGIIPEFRNSLVQNLFTRMIDERFQEAIKIPDTPFIYEYSYFGSFVRHHNGFGLGAGVKQGMIPIGVEMMLTELERIKKFGFTQTELDRQKGALLSDMEKEYNERDKMESGKLKWQFLQNYLNHEPIPGIEWKYNNTMSLLPNINLKDIEKLTELFQNEGNRVIFADSPELDDLDIPTKEELKRIYEQLQTKEIQPYVDQVVTEPLLAVIPEERGIKKINIHEETEIHEITLENGVRVLYKKTDFKNDEILMNAYSPGGTSQYSDSEFISANLSADFQVESGIGAYSKTALDKYLADKRVDVKPYISEMFEGFDGSCSPKDLETMLQIVYQYFHNQKVDEDAFKAYFQRYSGFISNRNARPETVFYDSVKVVMNNGHFRSRPMSTEILNELDRETSHSIFKDRFADADDFTFIFTGMIEEESFLPLLKKYLGNLPVTDRNENWIDVGKTFPMGNIKKTISKGMDPKSMVQIRYSGDFDWSRHNRFKINTLAKAFRIKLREILREEMGGTYGVWAWASPEQYPRERYQFGIAFGCAPENVKPMIKAVYEQVDSLKQFGLDQSYLDKVEEALKMDQVKNLKENKYWLNAIKSKDQYGEDFKGILDFNDLLTGLTKSNLIHSANAYLSDENVVEMVLYPENWEE